MSRPSRSASRRDFLKQSVALSTGLFLPSWTVAADVPKTAKRNDATTGDTQKVGAAIKLAKEVLENLKKISAVFLKVNGRAAGLDHQHPIKVSFSCCQIRRSSIW